MITSCWALTDPTGHEFFTDPFQQNLPGHLRAPLYHFGRTMFFPIGSPTQPNSPFICLFTLLQQYYDDFPTNEIIPNQTLVANIAYVFNLSLLSLVYFPNLLAYSILAPPGTPETYKVIERYAQSHTLMMHFLRPDIQHRLIIPLLGPNFGGGNFIDPVMYWQLLSLHHSEYVQGTSYEYIPGASNITGNLSATMCSTLFGAQMEIRHPLLSELRLRMTTIPQNISNAFLEQKKTELLGLYSFLDRAYSTILQHFHLEPFPVFGQAMSLEFRSSEEIRWINTCGAEQLQKLATGLFSPISFGYSNDDVPGTMHTYGGNRYSWYSLLYVWTAETNTHLFQLSNYRIISDDPELGHAFETASGHFALLQGLCALALSKNLTIVLRDGYPHEAFKAIKYGLFAQSPCLFLATATLAQAICLANQKDTTNVLQIFANGDDPNDLYTTPDVLLEKCFAHGVTILQRQSECEQQEQEVAAEKMRRVSQPTPKIPPQNSIADLDLQEPEIALSFSDIFRERIYGLPIFSAMYRRLTQGATSSNTPPYTFGEKLLVVASLTLISLLLGVFILPVVLFQSIRDYRIFINPPKSSSACLQTAPSPGFNESRHASNNTVVLTTRHRAPNQSQLSDTIDMTNPTGKIHHATPV